MKLTFLGAARTVTGSCYLLEVNGKKMLVDCGMFQGSKLITQFNRRPFAFAPGSIDAMILTHAHIDHSGLIPKLVKEGYKGPIHCTKSTQQLCTILLPDSAHIQESDAEFNNRKGMRAGRPEEQPLYSVDDAYTAMTNFVVHDFDQDIEVLPGVVAKFRVAGHILGSAYVELHITENGKNTKLIFTGDIGQPDQPIIDDPAHISGADFIVTESTYGNRVHEKSDKKAELTKIITETIAKGGNVVIPAFAVGRTQVLLYYFQQLLAEKKIPDVPIYIDSPMATKVTGITLNSTEEFDAEAQAIVKAQGKLYAMPNVHFTATPQESRMINAMEGPKIIMSASGMADAGRILHHLKHNLWRPECCVVFAGYQADGSMGRRLLDGVKMVKIMGEPIKVAATIYNMTAFSAHADKDQLLAWYKKMEQKPKIFFVTHGEYDASSTLAKILQCELGTATYVPQYGDEVEISGSEYKINQTPSISNVPDVAALRDYLKSLEADYLHQCDRIEKMVVQDNSKAPTIRKRLEKLKAAMDDLLTNV
ncbi:MAG: MBL fold metallo-hydrolase [Acidaminococcaceae bacterium]|jgi:metallo-beta-lactamase family protein|nr:MBL fold metallo-hydrolase [Acidaminococcaceae bacterium]